MTIRRKSPGRCVAAALLCSIVGATGFCSAGQAESNTGGGAAAAAAAGENAVRWWLEKPMRMIQTNLREIDATLDLDEYVRQIRACSANVVLFNVGGIVANYPTQLEFQYRNPHLEGDLVGSAVKRLHAEGIRVIGRFDFSKVNETIAARHPEWLYVSEKGKNVNYNGQVHTCINGGYQQERLFEILGEAIDRYPLDGVFFNMIGYVTRDYSGNYHGICQCGSCRKRFKSRCGRELPRTDDSGPTYREYEQFRRETSDELFRRVNAFIRSKSDGIAVCTYIPAGVDIIRKESNEDLGRWIYSASDNVMSVVGSWKDKVVSNASVHFIAFPYRHASVSPHLTALRVAQNMIHGGWLDHYVIGRLENQEDRASLGHVRDVFQLHARNEKFLSGTVSAATVLLVRGDRREYRGLFRILSENHVPFDVMEAGSLSGTAAPRALEDYALIVLPDVRGLGEPLLTRLDAYVRAGGKILWTGTAALRGADGAPATPVGLRVAGVSAVKAVHPGTRGTYFRVWAKDKRRLGESDFDPLDIVYLEGDLLECEPAEGTETFLGYIPVGMFGPPEKCYYSKVTRIPGLLHSRIGRGGCAFFPWRIGRHYEHRSHHGHSLLVMAAIDRLLQLERRLVMKASPLVEVSHRASSGGRFEWVGLVNLSGQNGTVFHQPLPVRDIPIELRAARSVRKIRLLKAARDIDVSSCEGGWVKCAVPELREYEILLFEYE